MSASVSAPLFSRKSAARAAVGLALFLAIRSGIAANARPNRHVVLVVWDGMRPDFVTPEYAPTLDRLAREGVRFTKHHSVYCTATDVNGAALATGVYPNRSGIFANAVWRPAIDPRVAVDVSEPTTIAAGDAATAGKYLGVPTLAELLRKEGKHVAIAGTKSVVLLHDRQSEWTIAATETNHLTAFAAAPMPPPLRDLLVQSVGPLPLSSTATSAEKVAYATRALTDVLWRDGVPDFSLLWLGEPDLAQHNHAPGSAAALAAIKSSDDALAHVIAALDQKHARETTDILVVSDHGFSTIRRSVDVQKLLADAGFHATKQFSESPQPGDILVVGNGGTVLLYVSGHERAVCERVVDWLEQSDFAGALFTRDKFEGTLPLSAVHIDTADAPDIVMSFRWSDDKNQFGAPGMIGADWNRPAGQATHATLSPFDVHNTFVANGPDFRRGFEDPAPTGNIDIAPTVLQLLGISGAKSLDGRVISEALRGSKQREPAVRTATITAKKAGEGAWQQWLRTSTVGKTTYFDSALGGGLPK